MTQKLGITVKKAELSDLCRLAEAERLCFSDAWSETALCSQIKGECYITLVAEGENGELLGYISGSVIPPEAEIFRIVSLPEYRRQGVGSLLLSQFEKELEGVGCTALFLEVRQSNLGAISFYKSFSFAETGKRRGYYKNPTEDAILLAKDLERA